MTMQSSFPVFETGQILSSTQLNDLTAYLEHQERQTRRLTIGIGVVCGLTPWFDPSGKQLVIEAGVGITSAGHLIAVPETRFDRISDYELPDMEREAHSLANLADPKDYPFFHKPNTNRSPISLKKAITAGEEPGPDHPPVSNLAQSDVSKKIIVLFLEGRVDGIDVCDINECIDKGSLANFNVRILLVSEQDARGMIDRERQFSARPVAAGDHPRSELAPVQISKLNPSAENLGSFARFMSRVVRIFSRDVVTLYRELNKAFNAYGYLLADMYPDPPFKEGPFPRIRSSRVTGIIHGVSKKFGNNIFAIQHIYDFLLDLADSHNEFIRLAFDFEAECAPGESRFPMHLMLGPADAVKPVAATGTGNTGLGPPVRPTVFRHHFVPSKLHDNDGRLLGRLRSLHYRTYLLAARIDTKDIFARDLKVIPSRGSGATLSDRAIPYYYEFAAGDDLHRNWSFDRTIRNQLAQVHSHRLSPDGADHPLLSRLDDHDFYRVEGAVGKPLPDVVRELVKERERLGLSFGIEPVYMGLEFDDDVETTALDRQVRASAQQAFLRMFHCKLKDLDLTFEIVVLFLFSYLTRIVIGLSKSHTRSLAVVKPFVAVLEVDSVAFEEEPPAEPPAGGEPPAQPPSGGRPGAGAAAGGAARARAVTGSRRTFRLADSGHSALLRTAAREAVSPRAMEAITARDSAGVEAPRLDMGSVEARILGGSPLLVNALTDFASLSHANRFAEERERSSIVLRDLRGKPPGKGILTDRLGDTSSDDTMAGLYKRILGLGDNRALIDKLKDVIANRNIGDNTEEATANLYPSMALLEKTEALVDELKAERIADFDFARFERAYVAFVSAYDAYIRHVDKLDNKADRELAAAQSEVIAAYGQIASTGVRTGIRSLLDEFQDRSRKIYLESVFENFARRNPGLEHQCGVPKGGTLVLAYAHRSLLGRVMGERSSALKNHVRPLFDAGNAPVPDLTDPRRLFRSSPARQDPMQDFVVVADFALPYRCCNAECEFLDFKPPVVRIPPPKVITGIVRGIRPNNMDLSILENATVRIINEDTGKPVANVDFRDGKFAFNAAPGTYSFEVRNRGFETSRRLISISEGGEHTENFELKQK